MVNGLALGGVNEAAGVEHADIRPLGSGHQSMAGLLDQGGHLLGIHQIFGTAQGNKGHLIYAQRDSSSISAP